MTAQTITDAPSKLGHASAVTDLALLFMVGAGAFFVENWARGAGLVSLPEATNGLFSIFATTVLVAALSLVRGGSWADLGLKRPRRFWTLPLWAVFMLVAFLAAQNLSILGLSQIVDIPRPQLARYDFLFHNVPALLMMLGVVWATASFPEELIYRGFVFSRLQSLLGDKAHAMIIVVVLQAAFFALAHFHAGVGGILVTFTMGLVWGVMYVLTGRNLWPLVLGHYLTDAYGVTALFFVQGSTIGG